MKEILFKFLLRPTAATMRFSPEIQILVNQPLHVSLKKLTNSLYFARRDSKERDASIMPILTLPILITLVIAESIILCESENSKRDSESFQAPMKSRIDLTIGLSDLYKLPAQGQGKAHSTEGKPNSLGACAPPQWWGKAGVVCSLRSL